MYVYEVRKVSYSKGKQYEMGRWLDHIIEEVILENMDTLPDEEVKLRSTKYTLKQEFETQPS